MRDNEHWATWRRLISGHSNGFASSRPRAALLALAVALVSLAPGAVAAADNAWTPQPYSLGQGQGLEFPEQGLRLGGYTSIHYYDVEHQPATVSVHDVSLFVTKTFGARWQVFSEMEVGDALTVSADRADSSEADFDVERLYADYHARQGVTLRLGKFLTPVGQWSLIHADPLVWTVSRPLVTAAAFSRHASGAMVYGTVPGGDNDLDYWLFADNTAQLDPAQRHELAYSADGASSPQHNNFDHASGARLLYHMFDDSLNVGASYLSFGLQQPDVSYHLGGLDFSWSGHRLDLSGEAVYRWADSGAVADERGGFLQAVVPLPHRLYLVGRTERYWSATLTDPTRLDVIGLNYRPRPALVFKLEHRGGDNNTLIAPSGWLGSFAVLF